MCATRLISKLSEVLSGGGNCVVRRKDVTFMQLKKKKLFYCFSALQDLAVGSRVLTLGVLIPVSMSNTLHSSTALLTIFHQKMQQRSYYVFSFFPACMSGPSRY